MNPSLPFWTALAALLVTCVAATGAESLRGFSRRRLDELCRRRSRPTLLAEVIEGRHDVLLAAETLQVLGTAVVVASVLFWIWQWQGPNRVPDGGLWAASAIAGGLGLLAVEVWLPSAVARIWAEDVVYSTWGLWKLSARILIPLVLVGRGVEAVLERLSGRERDDAIDDPYEEEIRTIVSAGHRKGRFEEDARDMIEGVIDLADADVAKIMTPRTDMATLAYEVGWDEMLAFVNDAKHTRIPVYRQNRDDIVGILYAKDLLAEMARPDGERRPWTAILRKPYFVPATKPVDALLTDFQMTRGHMAIVLDEYGGVCGVVTIEDVLEEIVGEIIDEYDEDLVEGIRTIDARTSDVLGRVHIHELNERLGLSLSEEEDYDTIGGFVFSTLGKIPTAGESMEVDQIRLTVLEASARRVERVRIERLDRVRQGES
jgi:CBS domain containing-hemolysin-like protein